MKKNILLIILIIIGMFVVLSFSDHNRNRSISACIMAQKNKVENFDLEKAKKNSVKKKLSNGKFKDKRGYN